MDEIRLCLPAGNRGFPAPQIHLLILNLQQIPVPLPSLLGLYQFCTGNTSEG